jgi:hypothetical protein
MIRPFGLSTTRPEAAKNRRKTTPSGKRGFLLTLSAISGNLMSATSIRFPRDPPFRRVLLFWGVGSPKRLHDSLLIRLWAAGLKP